MIVTTKRLYIFAAIAFSIAVALTILTYFYFHYYTDTGFVSVKQTEPAKPFMTYMFGFLTVLFLFSSLISLLIALVFKDKERAK